jgi:o-succinylbenzoate synthase
VTPDGLQLRSIELRWLDLDLRVPHSSALGTDIIRPVIVARLITNGPDGWGECAALATPYYSEEYASGAWSVICDYLIPILLGSARSQGGQAPESVDVFELLSPVKGHSMAKACIEMGLLDAELRAAGRSLADFLGVQRDRVEAGAVLGIADPRNPGSIEVLVGHVARLVSAGYSRVKLKIAPGADVAALAAVRGSFPDLGIQVDANSSYRLEDPTHMRALEALDDFDLLCVEQPLDSDDLLGHAQLAALLRTPVCLDESITSIERLRQALNLGACGMVCIKPARLGGIFQAVTAHQICSSIGMPLWCGGMLETALARTANAAIAGLPGFVLPGDLEGGERFTRPDPFLAGAPSDYPRHAEPQIRLFSGPGVGPAPDLDALDRVTTKLHSESV